MLLSPSAANNVQPCQSYFRRRASATLSGFSLSLSRSLARSLRLQVPTARRTRVYLPTPRTYINVEVAKVARQRSRARGTCRPVSDDPRPRVW